jgi:hypothetical protein
MFDLGEARLGKPAQREEEAANVVVGSGRNWHSGTRESNRSAAPQRRSATTARRR